ncbi:hypothetical protein A2U01_0069965, partial [Trifolium medium]|nr:hypothetical protein [Trifolium medium]
ALFLFKGFFFFSDGEVPLLQVLAGPNFTSFKAGSLTCLVTAGVTTAVGIGLGVLLLNHLPIPSCTVLG